MVTYEHLSQHAMWTYILYPIKVWGHNISYAGWKFIEICKMLPMLAFNLPIKIQYITPINCFNNLLKEQLHIYIKHPYYCAKMFLCSCHVTINFKSYRCNVREFQCWTLHFGTCSTQRIVRWRCKFTGTSFSFAGIPTAIPRIIKVRIKALWPSSTHVNSARRCHKIIRWVT